MKNLIKSLFLLSLLFTLASFSDFNENKTNFLMLSIEPINTQYSGAGCYYSLQKNQNSKTILHIDAMSGTAYMRINGSNQTFNFNAKNRNFYENKIYKLTVETKQNSSGNESMKMNGFITIESNEGEIIKTKVYGDCGA